MRIVTGFDDSFEEPDKKPEHPLTDYLHAIDALEHNHEVALNVFARAAKKTLHERLPNASFGKTHDDELAGLPLWITENSIVFDLKDKKSYADAWESIRQKWGEELHSLISKIADHIEEVTNPKGQLILVDALKVRMLEVAPQAYRFTAKQMWTVMVKIDG